MHAAAVLLLASGTHGLFRQELVFDAALHDRTWFANRYEEQIEFHNKCSACQAAAHQGGIVLMAEVLKVRAGQQRRHDAADKLATLCSKRYSGWRQYGLFMESPVGLIAGPGLGEGFDDLPRRPKNRGQRMIDDNIRQKLRDACAGYLLGGELDEDELFEIAQKAADPRSTNPSNVQKALRQQLCEASQAPCTDYWNRYGFPADAESMRKKPPKPKPTLEPSTPTHEPEEPRHGHDEV
jgi:hypothetical protein